MKHIQKKYVFLETAKGADCRNRRADFKMGLTHSLAPIGRLNNGITTHTYTRTMILLHICVSVQVTARAK